MSDFTLYLDAVAFQEFEIPDSIKAGGAQALFKHKYPGGSRTIDTMGPDDDDITWSGTFMDATAQDRCRQLDTLRRQGQPVVVTWAGYQYLVIVADFKFDFRRFWEIPYTITLAVIQDETYPGQAYAQDIGSQTASDASSAMDDASVIAYAVPSEDVQSSSLDSGGIAGAISGAASSVASAAATAANAISGAMTTAVATASGVLTDAVGAVSSTLNSAAASLTNSTVNFQVGLGNQVQTALYASQSLQSTLDATMDAAGAPASFASGMPPQQMIASVNNLVGVSTALAANVNCTNTLGRMSINLGLLGK